MDAKTAPQGVVIASDFAPRFSEHAGASCFRLHISSAPAACSRAHRRAASPPFFGLNRIVKAGVPPDPFAACRDSHHPTRIGLQRLNSRFVSIGNRHEARKAGVHNSPHAVEDLVRRQGVFRLVGRSHIAGPRERPTISVTSEPHKLVKPNCLPGMCPDMAAEPRPHSASHQCVAVGAHSAWLDRGGALGQQRLWQTFASPHRGSAGLSQDRQSEVRVSRFLDIRGEHDPLPLCRNFREVVAAQKVPSTLSGPSRSALQRAG